MALDYFKAKEAGYSDEDIAAYYAQEKGVDYNKAIAAGYAPLEIIGGLGYGMDVTNPTTNWDAFTRGLERGVTGTTRGVGQVMTKVSGLERQAPGEDVVYDEMGNVISGGSAPSVQEVRTGETVKQADQRKELEYEIAKAQGNKVASYGGYIAGTLADPANIIGGLGTPTVKSLVKEGLITGGVQGFFDPLYGEADTYGTRAVNAAMGATGGGVIGAGFGKLLKKFGVIEKPEAPKVSDEIPTPSTKAMDDALNEPVTPKTGVEEPFTVPKQADEAAPAPVSQATPEDLAPPSLATPSFVPDPYTAKLPQGLSKAAPRYGRDVTGFQSDLDRALYIVRDSRGQRSKADAAYLNWVKQVTGIQDEGTIRRLGDDVLAHLKASGDVGNIPPSNLNIGSLRATVDQVGIPTPTSTITKPTAPYTGSVGTKLEAGINPESNAWNSLDNTSKNLYNMGRRFLEADLTGVKPRINPNEQLDAIRAVKSFAPDFKEKELPDLFKSYTKAMDDLYKVKGDDFEAPSLDKLLRQGLSDEDIAELINKGVFDGCTL